MGAVKKQATAVKRKGKAVEYFKGVVSELKKVYWPSRKQVITYTGVVLITVSFVAVLIWLFDSVLAVLLAKILGL